MATDSMYVCILGNFIQQCTEDHEEGFAVNLEALLSNQENKESEINYYAYYIHDHLKNYCDGSLSCARLW